VDLQHPVIVGVFESGTHQGRPYVVMEYVEGQTFTHLLATRGAFKIPDVLRIGAALGDALRYAHLRGLVHREITGSSVMLTAEGEVKLLELGLSAGDGKRVVPSSAPPEQAAHFSPEVASGGAAGPASDIWGLGVLLYECLTGRLPFRSESTPTVLQKILSEAPARPATLRSGTPPDLERMILRCLEKEPERRYPSAADSVVELCAAGAPKPRAMAVSIAEESKPVPAVTPAAVVLPLVVAKPVVVVPPVPVATRQRWCCRCSGEAGGDAEAARGGAGAHGAAAATRAGRACRSSWRRSHSFQSVAAAGAAPLSGRQPISASARSAD
jgi:serine/threonine-protein kinase